MILSIIIPVFNEEKTIKTLLKRVDRVKLPNGIKKEIIVVDDGSYDQTPQILKKIKNVKFRSVRLNKNFGKGEAVRYGLKLTSGDLIIIQDADLEYNPKDYLKMLEPIFKEGSNVVYGTRLVNYPFRLWGKNKSVLPIHLLANRFLTRLTNFLYGSNLTDMETCYKLFKKNIIKNVDLEAKGFDFEPEITAKLLKKGVSIKEVPISSKPRTYKEGKKISWIDGLTALWTLIKYRF